jgi:hypothetical protein
MTNSARLEFFAERGPVESFRDCPSFGGCRIEHTAPEAAKSRRKATRRAKGSQMTAGVCRGLPRDLLRRPRHEPQSVAQEEAS